MLASLAHKMANIPLAKRFLTKNRLFIRLYFNWRYRNEDPYFLTNSDYEKEKFRRVVATLKKYEPFDLTIEVGCGEGALTEALCDLCESVEAVDISDMAVSRARKRVKGKSNATVRQGDVFTEIFAKRYQLVVCSEVLFYFERLQLPQMTEKLIDLVDDSGYLLLTHARVTADDTAGIDLKKFGAKTIHAGFLVTDRFDVIVDDLQPMYRITLLKKK